jgi:type 1 glutamine amidotransferase
MSHMPFVPASWISLAAAGFAAAGLGGSAAETRAAEKTTKIVLLAGAPSHGYGSHEHKAGCLLLADCLNKNVPGVQAVVCDGWPADAAALKDAAAIVAFCDGNGRHVLSGKLEEVDKLMKKGVGLACLHYAVELPKGPPGDYLLQWIGGYFEVFWSVNPFWKAEFKSFPDHPVARGVRPFAIDDEWYYHMRFRPNMEGVTPILTAIPPDATRQRPDGPHSGNAVVRARKGMPEHVAWACQRADGGRGFGFTGGHWHWAWANDDFRKVVLNGIVWVAGLDPPPGGVPSQTPTFEQLEANQDYPQPPDFDRKKWIDLLKSWKQ